MEELTPSELSPTETWLLPTDLDTSGHQDTTLLSDHTEEMDTVVSDGTPDPEETSRTTVDTALMFKVVQTLMEDTYCSTNATMDSTKLGSLSREVRDQLPHHSTTTRDSKSEPR